jgi:hypothetical protein
MTLTLESAMRLDDDKLNEWEACLQAEEDQLVKELDTLALTALQRADRKQALQTVREKRAAHSRIVARNILRLTGVTRKVFVSTRFEAGQLPDWLAAVFAEVQTQHGRRHRGRLEFLLGTAEGAGDYRRAILQNLIECHYFLSVVTKETEPPWPVRPYLVEEVGAAFPLPKITIIAVEYGIDPEKVGKLFGPDWQRLRFDRTATGLEKLAADLSDALHLAPEQQAEALERKRRALAVLFS